MASTASPEPRQSTPSSAADGRRWRACCCCRSDVDRTSGGGHGQTCQAAGGTLGRNQLTEETNGTYGVGTGANQSFPLDRIRASRPIPTEPAARLSNLDYPPDDGCYAVTTRRDLSATPPSNPNGGFGTWHRHSGHTTGTATDKVPRRQRRDRVGVFYRQTITGLMPGTNYEFGTWVLNLND